jgi:signal transduction histidine kinase
MNPPRQGYVKERGIGRRKEDWLLRDHLHRYTHLFHVGQIITSEINMDVLFEVIMDQTNQIMDTERCTVFLYDDKSDRLWSLVATGMKKNEISIPHDYGIAGWVFQNKAALIINDAYHDPRFYPEIDRRLGFKTKNILCIPLINRQRECIGTIEALNKGSGDFTDRDRELLTSVSHYVTVALENSRLYEDLKLLDKAKERIINHLSHELKTPLALISSAFEKISRTLGEDHHEGLDKAIGRGRRSVDRLLDLQAKIDDILHQRSFEDKEKILAFIEDAVSFVEEEKEAGPQHQAELWDRISQRLESLYSTKEIQMEEISLFHFLDKICNEAISSMGDRELTFIRSFERDLTLTMDREDLRKICSGLLRNSIENTPDEGKIEVIAVSKGKDVCIDVRDYGVGITEENQKMIFGGFFHTQDTELYSSRRPYEFNAGGSGSDLLRAKSFSEQYGFTIDFQSTRCPFIPDDRDRCPGRISSCTFIPDKSQCFSSGGSTFSLIFPEKADKKRQTQLEEA